MRLKNIYAGGRDGLLTTAGLPGYIYSLYEPAFDSLGRSADSGKIEPRADNHAIEYKIAKGFGDVLGLVYAPFWPLTFYIEVRKNRAIRKEAAEIDRKYKAIPASVMLDKMIFGKPVGTKGLCHDIMDSLFKEKMDSLFKEKPPSSAIRALENALTSYTNLLATIDKSFGTDELVTDFVNYMEAYAKEQKDEEYRNLIEKHIKVAKHLTNPEYQKLH